MSKRSAQPPVPANVVPPLFRARLRVEQFEDRLVFSAGTAPFDGLLVQYRDRVEPTVVELPRGADLATALAALQADPAVRYAEPNYIVSIDRIPNDTRFGELWGMNNTGQSGGKADADTDAAEAWDLATGTGKTVVAVIDTGIDYRHPDLYLNVWINQGEIPANAGVADTDGDGRITFYDLNNAANQGKVTDGNGNGLIDGGDLIRTRANGGWADGTDTDGNGYRDDLIGWDFANNDNDPFDDNSHGTHTSGTIGAIGNNGVGVAGVAWRTQIMPVKFLAGNGSGTDAAAIQAIDYATKNGARASNNSWGGGGFSQAMADAITRAGAAGSVFVAAAGNDGSNNDSFPHYPSSYPNANIVAVAATDRTDSLAYFSNTGATSVDLGAPGVAVLSTTPNNTYSSYDGTSMATPHVTGSLALLLGYSPGMTSMDAANLLIQTGDKIAALAGQTASGRRLNVFNALKAAGPDLTPPAVTAFAGLGTDDTLTGLRVTFSEAINPGSFDKTDVTSLTGPSVPTVAGVAAVAGTNNTQFDITFTAPQTAAGAYAVTFGPDITDAAGNKMAQPYTGTYSLTPHGPRVTAAAWTGTEDTLTALRVTFSEPVNPASFTADPLAGDVALTGPGTPPVAIPVSAVTAVAGSGNTQFDITFAAQTVGGKYGVAVGPNITDLVGNAMDQDGDGRFAETPDDQFTGTFTLAPKGPSVTALTTNATEDTASSFRLTFSEAVDPDSFKAGDVTIVGPGVLVGVSGVAPVAGSGNTQFDVTFPRMTMRGTYTVQVGPNITDTAGHPMDKAYTGKFALTALGPQVAAFARNGTGGTVSSVTVTFNEPLAVSGAGGFDPGDILFTGPSGAVIPVTAVTPAGGNAYTVSFAPQTAVGTYQMAIDPRSTTRPAYITDAAGNPLDQNRDGTPGDGFTGTFALASTQTQTFTSESSTIIGFGLTMSSPLTISASGTILDLNVIVDISFPWDSDLILSLRAPNGRTITLANRVGGSGANFYNTTFDDEAAGSIRSGSAPFYGSFRPELALSAFDGLNMQGTWRLRVTDAVGADFGWLNTWSMVVTTGIGPGGLTVRSSAAAPQGIAPPETLVPAVGTPPAAVKATYGDWVPQVPAAGVSPVKTVVADQPSGPAMAYLGGVTGLAAGFDEFDPLARGAFVG